jgi:hypothetical protein
MADVVPYWNQQYLPHVHGHQGFVRPARERSYFFCRSMSAFGTKQTFRLHGLMSALGIKRTLSVHGSGLACRFSGDSCLRRFPAQEVPMGTITTKDGVEIFYKEARRSALSGTITNIWNLYAKGSRQIDLVILLLH